MKKILALLQSALIRELVNPSHENTHQTMIPHLQLKLGSVKVNRLLTNLGLEANGIRMGGKKQR